MSSRFTLFRTSRLPLLLLYALAIAFVFAGCSAKDSAKRFTEGTGEFVYLDGKKMHVSDINAWNIPIPYGFRDFDANEKSDSHSPEYGAWTADMPWLTILRKNNSARFEAFAFYALADSGLPEFSVAQLWVDREPSVSLREDDNVTMSEAILKYLSYSTPIDEADWAKAIGNTAESHPAVTVFKNGDKLVVGLTIGEGRQTPEDAKHYQTEMNLGSFPTSSYPNAAALLTFNFEGKEIYMLMELCPLKEQATLKDVVDRLVAWKNDFVKLNAE